MYICFTQATEAGIPGRVSVEPHRCICPSQNYTCQADNVIRMRWVSESLTSTGGPIIYSLLDDENERMAEQQRDGLVQVTFKQTMIVESSANISSSLFITNLTLNETNITCHVSVMVGQNCEETIPMCIIG